MDEAERKALIRGMSAELFALGNLYTLFQRIRCNPNVWIDTSPKITYTAFNLVEMGIPVGRREER